MIHSGDLDFSFSGLKTAVLTLRNKLAADSELNDADRADIAASFQEAIVEVLVAKSMAALKANAMSQLVVAGGVGANRPLRERLRADAAKQGLKVFFPPLDLCTDNGAMIAFAAALRIESDPSLLSHPSTAFSVRPRWALGDLAA
jgi:N6-L-threonylcarbamoyladenine synthase